MLNWIIHLSLRNRGLTLVLALVVCVVGVFAAAKLPIDVLPDLNRPTVSILTEAPGLAPEDVEAQVTLPLETAMNGAAGVERVRSVSSMGLSVVHVEFGWSTDIRFNRQVVQERINEASERLPRGMSPHMGPISSIMGEIMLMGLGSEPAASGDGTDAGPVLDPMALRSTADWVLRPVLLSIPGVAQVTVQGGEVRQIQVRADPERLRAFDLTIGELEEAVRRSNESAPGGFLVTTGQERPVRNLGRARNAEDVAGALVAMRASSVPGTKDGPSRPVLVRDVATVIDAPAITKRGDGSMMGKPAVVMAIAKQPGADSRQLTRAIDETLARLAPTLPKGLIVNPNLFRQSHFIEASVHNVIDALRDGSILVVIVLGLFLMNLRTTVITLTAIPLSLLTTFIVFRLMGETINTMTLGGIAVAIGELVDDAVVGVENVFRRLKENRASKSPRSMAQVVFDATSEVRQPILIGTTIVLLVFLPLYALPGLPGRLFSPLATAYIVSILASMVVSLTVTPALSALLLGRMRATSADHKPERDGPVLRACKRVAMGAYGLAMPRPWMVVGMCIVAVVIAAVTVTRIGSEFLPGFNEGTAVVGVVSAPGTSLDEANRLGTLAETILLEQVPEVKSVARRTGRVEQDEHALGVNTTEIEVDFWKHDDDAATVIGGNKPKPATLRSRGAVFADIRERLSALPGVFVSIGQPISHRIEHLETGVQAQIVVKVFGDELSMLRRLGEQVRAAMDGLPGVVDLRVEQQTLVPQIAVRVNPERAAHYGFKSGEVVDAVETAMEGKVVSLVYEGLRAVDLVVTVDPLWRSDVESMKSLRLLSPSGAVALISDVAEVTSEPGPNEVQRENVRRRLVVSCNVQGQDLGRTATAIRDSIAMDVTPPPGYSISVEGQFETQQRATRAILLLGFISLLVMGFILHAHFGSAFMAVQVMLNVPFAFIGSVAALVATGQPFSVASLVGFISLCGISSRNGVLMISHYMHLMRYEGMPFGREMVIKGSQERVAPVLMTALTTGLGLVPLVLAADEPGKEILYPVAVVVLGGLVTSTILDFVVTPAVFLKFGKRASERLANKIQANDVDTGTNH